MWCFDRFGKSETTLPDGRVIHIGGEHEDYYDPDFFIYNDVTVVGPDGSIEIRGYAREAFPPTDFHSATLAGNAIFIVGRLGYPEQRVPGRTPVFRLALDTMAITPVETSGEEPGWLQRHSAELADDGRAIIVRGGELWLGDKRTLQENIDSWSLSPSEPYGRTRTKSSPWRRPMTVEKKSWNASLLDFRSLSSSAIRQ